MREALVQICGGIYAEGYASAAGDNQAEGLSNSAGARFYPSRRSAPKYSENAATFSEFLGQEKKPRFRANLQHQTLSTDRGREKIREGA